MTTRVILTAFAFCLLSSCIYVINDIFDIESDKNHPIKKLRPIPSGRISNREAISIALLLGAIGFLLGYEVSLAVLAILLAYFIMNMFYDFWLKQIVLLDVFCISAGFMLRILAGTYGVGIPPSKWLLLCGLMITLFLGFSKRKAELISGMQNKHEMREVLRNYSPALLDELISICAAAIIITYSLYTMSSQTMHIHHTSDLIYTVPFVIYALFRYIYLLHRHQTGEDPTGDLLKDRHILAAVAGWSLLTFYLIKLH